MGFVKDDRARKKLVKAILLICSLTVIASMAVYQFTPARNSDYVEGVIWASESLKAGALLNPDYIYPYAIVICQ